MPCPVNPAAACGFMHESLSCMSTSCVSNVAPHSPDPSVECGRTTTNSSTTSSVAYVVCPAAAVPVCNAFHTACSTEQPNAQPLFCPVSVGVPVQYCRYPAGSSSLPRKSDVLRGTAGGDAVCLSDETPSGATCNLGAGSPTGVILRHLRPSSCVSSLGIVSTCCVPECTLLHHACAVAPSTNKAEQSNALPVPVLSCSSLSCVGVALSTPSVHTSRLSSPGEVAPWVHAPLPRTPSHGVRLECKFLRQGPAVASTRGLLRVPVPLPVPALSAQYHVPVSLPVQSCRYPAEGVFPSPKS